MTRPVDCQLVVMLENNRFDLTHVLGFVADEGADHWGGGFTVLRGSNFIDAFLAQLPMSGTLYEYVAEGDGSTSTYQFEGARLFDALPNRKKRESKFVGFTAVVRRRI